MTTFRTITSSVLLAAMTAGTCLFLLRIGGEAWIPTPGEILDSPPDEAVIGCIWLATLSVVAWLLCSAFLSVCAYTVRIPAAIRTVEWMTIRPVRRLAQRLAALILAIGSISASYPAGAVHLPPVPIVASSEQEQAVDSHTAMITGVTTPILMTGETVRGPARTGESGGKVGVSTPAMLRAGDEKAANTGEYVEYVVQPGDSIWSVSSVHVHRSQTGPVPAYEIVRVWLQVVELNRGRLRSGDPDLIYPGEILMLPDLSLPGGL